MVNQRPYDVDGEAGRFHFTTHRVVDDGKSVFDTSKELFPTLRGKEYYRTVGFKEIAYIYGDTNESFRKTAELINRFRYQQQDGTPSRTLQNGKGGTANIRLCERSIKSNFATQRIL